MEPTMRIALLIDADNASAATLEQVLSEIADQGAANVRRAYGDWGSAHLGGWRDALLANAIQPIQQIAYTRKGNASDMAMVIDAMDLLYSGKFDGFALMSSDTDFTPLVTRLRAANMRVYGFGKAQTPNPFKVACSVFFNVDSPDQALPSANRQPVCSTMTKGEPNEVQKDREGTLQATAHMVVTGASGTGEQPIVKLVQPPKRKSGAELRSDTSLTNLLRNAVQAARGDDGQSHLGAVGQYIANRGSFTPKNYGYGTLKGLIMATEMFELGKDGNHVRAKPRQAKGSVQVSVL